MDKDRPARARTTTRGTRPRYAPARKVCAYCANKNATIDYKEYDKLRAYISDRGKIEPRRRSGACARHQRLLAVAIKRARHLALLPYVAEHVRKVGGIGARGLASSVKAGE